MDELCDPLARRAGVRQRHIVIDALMCGGMHMDGGAVGFEHRAHADELVTTVHPVQRLREGRDPHRRQLGWQLLCAQLPPTHITDVPPPSLPGGLGQHVRISIHTNGFGKVRSEQQRQRSRSATDIERAAEPVQRERLNQHLDDLDRIAHPAHGVEVRAARIKRGVPRPPR